MAVLKHISFDDLGDSVTQTITQPLHTLAPYFKTGLFEIRPSVYLLYPNARLSVRQGGGMGWGGVAGSTVVLSTLTLGRILRRIKDVVD